MPRHSRTAETLTLVFWGLVKLLGLLSAANQLLITAHPSQLALGISALFVAGGQAAQSMVLAVLDRVFTTEKKDQRG